MGLCISHIKAGRLIFFREQEARQKLWREELRQLVREEMNQ
jgi:hypothetical protein